MRASRSIATADTYATGLNHLQAYLRDRGLPPDQTDVDALTPAVITDFIAWLYDYLVEKVADGDERRVSEWTKATYFAAVSGFLDYLVVETARLPMDGTSYDAVRRNLARASRRRSNDRLPPEKLYDLRTSPSESRMECASAPTKSMA